MTDETITLPDLATEGEGITRSLRTRVSALVAGAALIVVGSAGVALLEGWHRAQHEAAAQRAVGLLEALGATLRPAIALRGEEGVRDTLAEVTRLGESLGLEGLLLADADGRALAAAGRVPAAADRAHGPWAAALGRDPHAWSRRPDDDGLLVRSAFDAGERRLVLTGSFAPGHARSVSAPTTLAVAIGVVGISLVLMVLVYAGLSRLVIRPLAALDRTARALRDGDLAARARVDGHGEVARLALTFNAMASHLEYQTRLLETKVARRTRLVESKNRELEAVNAKLEHTVGRLDHLARTDELTGLLNRRAFLAALREALGAGGGVALVMLDLDHFKRVNDLYGHPAGDRALQEVARVLRVRVRRSDVLGRYGGEELAVLLRDVDQAGALRVAEGLRHAVAEHGFDAILGVPLGGLTLSAGVALYPDDAPDEEALLRRADHALYEAKGLGRNRVEAWSSGMPTRQAAAGARGA